MTHLNDGPHRGKRRPAESAPRHSQREGAHKDGNRRRLNIEARNVPPVDDAEAQALRVVDVVVWSLACTPAVALAGRHSTAVGGCCGGHVCSSVSTGARVVRLAPHDE